MNRITLMSSGKVIAVQVSGSDEEDMQLWANRAAVETIELLSKLIATRISNPHVEEVTINVHYH